MFTAFSGYDSQCLALNRLGIPYDLVGWSEIDKAVNLSEIEDFARNVLKMRYPDKSRTIYYTGETEDYFRQYESVSTGN